MKRILYIDSYGTKTQTSMYRAVPVSITSKAPVKELKDSYPMLLKDCMAIWTIEQEFDRYFKHIGCSTDPDEQKMSLLNLDFLDKVNPAVVGNFAVNTNNRSHGISAVLAGRCFSVYGKPEREKLIINFDRHPDYGIDPKKEYSKIEYHTWGNCIHNVGFKTKFGLSGCALSYLVVGYEIKGHPVWRCVKDGVDGYAEGPVDMNAVLERITPFATAAPGLDIYITVDTDVYKGSGTVYDDGLLERGQVLEMIEAILKMPDINLCGMDVTGLPTCSGGKVGTTPLKESIVGPVLKDALEFICNLIKMGKFDL